MSHRSTTDHPAPIIPLKRKSALTHGRQYKRRRTITAEVRGSIALLSHYLIISVQVSLEYCLEVQDGNSQTSVLEGAKIDDIEVQDPRTNVRGSDDAENTAVLGLAAPTDSSQSLFEDSFTTTVSSAVSHLSITLDFR